MKKNRQIAQRIKKFREDHYSSQKAFADALGMRQSVVSAWEIGDNIPSCEAWVKIGNIAGYPENIEFWERAGLRREAMAAAAKLLGKNILIRPKEGDMVPIDRYRFTEKGMEKAGPAVPFALEFIPDPVTTICLSLAQNSLGVVDAPTGLFILDRSIEGTEDLRALLGRVVMIHYDRPGLGMQFPKGFYVGRVIQMLPVQLGHQSEAVGVSAALLSLTGNELYQRVFVGNYEEPKGLAGIPLEDVDARKLRMTEIQDRALTGIRLYKGIRILGRVIGRLTGHLEASREGKK